MSAMLVGPDGDAADKVAAGFEHAFVRVVRARSSAAACESLPVTMPQIVVVIGTLRADERDSIADRATAVGALVLDVDPELDEETLAELISRAASAALTRKIMRDDSGPAGAAEMDGPDEDIDIDEQW